MVIRAKEVHRLSGPHAKVCETFVLNTDEQLVPQAAMISTEATSRVVVNLIARFDIYITQDNTLPSTLLGSFLRN